MTVDEDPVLSPRTKSFPPDSWGRRVSQAVAGRPELARFQTPVVALDRTALSHNTRTVLDWVRASGLHLAPHGKTTMAPVLWHLLMDAGAWGMTFATAWQAQVARDAGIRRIMIANAVTDPAGLRWIAAELAAHPDVEISCWADSADTVLRMEEILATPERRVPVIAELGAPGGRTGARTVRDALSVAEAIADSPALELAGVGGYEGALAHDRSSESLARIDAYLDGIRELHGTAGDLYRHGAVPIVTAGGSAYPDRVAARLGSLSADADVVLRSGAFQIHDDGFYAGISPFGREVATSPLRSAMHAWVRVVSHPEPGLVLLDGGRRDLSFDEGLPVPQRVMGLPTAESDRILAGAEITRLNDQHAFLRLASGAPAGALRPGTVIRLGLSHPCTVLDKWRLVPVVADADADSPVVVDAVATWF